MAEFPALPFFTDAYLADTRHLTSEEHGAYLLLLFCAWRTRGCALKDCDKVLARITGLSPTKWRRLRPTISEFFEITDGVWRQKKLLAVYADVTKRVARNKANGAKGGKARAGQADAAAEIKPKPARLKPFKPEPTKREGNLTSQPETDDPNVTSKATHKATPRATHKATKAKTKSCQPASRPSSPQNSNAFEQAPEEWRAAVRDACGPEIQLDDGVLFQWAAAGADIEQDIVPTIKTVKYREVSRTGRSPKTLGYFRAAVLEAITKRVVTAGTAPAQNDKRPFNPNNEVDWRILLGDASSAFRADYMAKNWFISRDHPVFQAAELGPNPRLTKTDHLPQAIRKAYAHTWRWLSPC
jgi:uncharacterized protein YdaU (DUF1376 family)